MSQRAAVPQARPSVITCAARCRTGASARDTDPIVEAHFRRSLGSQYAALFATPSAATEASVTVDDHFAKALGDTWRRLQDQEPQGVTS
ncbi:unnamed protein product [Ixodes persulcatus]